MVFIMFTDCASINTINFRTILLPSATRNSVPFSSRLFSSKLPRPRKSLIHFLSVSIDFPVLNIAYK